MKNFGEGCFRLLIVLSISNFSLRIFHYANFPCQNWKKIQFGKPSWWRIWNLPPSRQIGHCEHFVLTINTFKMKTYMPIFRSKTGIRTGIRHRWHWGGTQSRNKNDAKLTQGGISVQTGQLDTVLLWRHLSLVQIVQYHSIEKHEHPSKRMVRSSPL